MKKIHALFLALALLAAASLSVPTPSSADDAYHLSEGQTVYVPAYSHIYHGPKKREFNLLILLSVRNTDPKHSLTITSVDYYDSSGKVVGHKIDKPQTLVPMATAKFFVEEADTKGGSGANFLVTWKADTRINTPVIESMMVGTAGNQGIVFNCPGRPIIVE